MIQPSYRNFWVKGLIILTWLMPWMAGCQQQTNHASTAPYETLNPDPHHDVSRAQEANARGLKLLEAHKLPEAEKAFKNALAADLTFGPAHNNLGRVYFEQSQLYLAAWEFQYAIKLLPGRPEPLNNLGLVYEAAGKLNEAIEAYRKAVAAAPGEPEYAGNLARAKVRRGDKDEELRRLLQNLVERDNRPEWSHWARDRLTKFSRSP